jgi:hypothetical protein
VFKYTSSLIRPLRLLSAGFNGQGMKLSTFSNLLFAPGISGVLHPNLLLVDSRHFSRIWINCFKQSIFGPLMCYLALHTSLHDMNKEICILRDKPLTCLELDVNTDIQILIVRVRKILWCELQHPLDRRWLVLRSCA